MMLSFWDSENLNFHLVTFRNLLYFALHSNFGVKLVYLGLLQFWHCREEPQEGMGWVTLGSLAVLSALCLKNTQMDLAL